MQDSCDIIEETTGLCTNIIQPSILILSQKFMIMILVRFLRIYHECEGRIEKFVPRITVWHHEACRVMTNGDPEGWIFLSYPHTNNRLAFLAHLIRISEILPMDRKSYLTHAILLRLSREGYIHWWYWNSRTWSYSDVIVMMK